MYDLLLKNKHPFLSAVALHREQVRAFTPHVQFLEQCPVPLTEKVDRN
jgi:hypothetical protein